MMNRKIAVCLFLGLLFVVPVQAQNVKEISLETALHKIIENNLTAGILKYEVKQADSDYERSQTKYSPFINASASHQYSDMDLSGMSPALDAMYGAKYSANEAAINIGQTFKTGTSVVGGYKYSNMDFSKAPAAMTGYPTTWNNPTAFIQVKQALLKNGFGYSEAMQEELLKNQRDSKQIASKYQLSGLMVSGIFDYFTVTEKQRKLFAAQSELSSYKKIYDAVKDNVSFGLYEKYNLYQFNALISGSQAKLAGAELNYKKATHKLLCDLNMPESKEDSISLVSVDESLHKYDVVSLYETALKKRADILQAKLALDSAEKQVKMIDNQALPDAQLELQGVDERLNAASTGSNALKYLNWSAKVSVTKLLSDTDSSIKQRNAKYQLEQAKLQYQNLKNQIKYEVADGVETIQTAYIGVEKTKEMVRDSDLYLNALQKRLRQGKLSTVELKNAVDMTVAANNAYSEAVTGYNMAQLNLDLVTNTIFEKYHLDINKAVGGIK